MKSYLDLVGQYGRVHRKKHRITIFCIIIAVSLVTAIFGMADMQVRVVTIGQIKTNGNWHVSFADIDNETARLIGSRADVAASGWQYMVDASDGYTLYDNPIAITGLEKDLGKELGLEITKGRFPQNAGECLLDPRALEKYSLSLGSNISITFPGKRIHSFTVVGTFSDLSSLQKQDIHAVLLSYEGLRQLSGGDSSRNRYYVQFKDGADMRRAIDEIKAKYRIPEDKVSENLALLGLAGQSRNEWMLQLYMVTAILFVLVLAAGVLMIASSFNMSVLERIQFFGLMRCLGASRAQVKRFVLLEGIRLSLKGIPAGLLIGIVVVWIASAFLKYVNSAFYGDMPLFALSWPSLAFGAAVGFLTVLLASLSPCKKAARVSPLSAVTGNIGRADAPHSGKAVNTGRMRVDIAMGIHHAFSDKKNILLMTGSFAISIILFLCLSMLVDFMHQAFKPLKPYTPDVSIVSGDNTSSLDAELFGQVESNPGVKRAYGRMFAYDVPVESPRGNGRINLISYEEHQFNWANEQLTQGSIDEAANGTDGALVVYSDDLKWKVGDTITLKLSSGEKAVRIVGMLSSSPFDSVAGTQTVICSEKTFTGLTGRQGYTIVDIQLFDSADDGTVSQLRKLAAPGMKFPDRRQSNTEARTAYYSFAIFVYGFLAVIALITVFNIINSMNTSVSGRMNQYGVMRAVGMSGRQLQRMVVAEAAAYAVCGCLAGCAVGLPLHRINYRLSITSHWGIEWRLPLAALGIIIGIAVLTTFLSVIGPVRKINRMDVVNVVNAQ
jgi:putative ABC transport system permease protein